MTVALCDALKIISTILVALMVSSAFSVTLNVSSISSYPRSVASQGSNIRNGTDGVQGFQGRSAAQLEASGISSVPSNVSGTIRAIVVPVRFSDFSNMTSLESNVIPLSILPVVSYYNEVSYGELSLDINYSLSWFTLPRTKAFYSSHIDEFIVDSLSVANDSVTYSLYQAVMLVHAGNDQAETRVVTDIWSQASMGMQDYNYDGALFGFTILAETDPYGVYAHEFGHNIGLPDLYDYSQTTTFVNDWSLMDHGSWLMPPTSLMAPEKMWLGWIPSSNTSIISDGHIFNITLARLETQGQTLAIKIPVGSTCYTVEYRTKALTDLDLPMEGVIVSYVDESLGSGQGIVKVKDARPSSQSLRDAAFTSGMRFLDMANEVAVKVWSLDLESANIMAQKGFADLSVGGIQYSGEPVEGKSINFTVQIKNTGKVPSNFARVSLTINGTEFQRKDLPSVNPNETVTLEFGSWQAKLGTNQVRVFADIDDNVAEKNKTNNALSVDLNVSPRYISIDQAQVSRQRADVNSAQQVSFHAKWADNSSDLVGGWVYVNGSAYITNSTGWITLTATPTIVCNLSWHVTGVDAGEVFSFNQEVPNPYIVWDTLQVYDSGVSRDRCDIGSIQSIWVRLRYAYDGRSFDNATGALSINGTAARWDANNGYWVITDSRHDAGQNDYAVPSTFEDRLYELTSIFGRTRLSIIWDKVVIGISVDRGRIDVGSAVDIKVNGIYEYDSTIWNGTVVFNDTLTKSEAVLVSYTVVSITDSNYGLTDFLSNVTSVAFDRVIISILVPDTRIDVGAPAQVVVAGNYEYDGSAWNGTYALNDTLTKTEVGMCDFAVVSMADPSYNLTAFKSNSISIVWDRVNVSLSSSQERVEVGSRAPIEWSAFYEYDGQVFNGSIIVNGSLVRRSIGLANYHVNNISDLRYGLAAFTGNTVDVVFDQITYQIITDSLEPGKVQLNISLTYRSDGTPVTDANVTVGGKHAENVGQGRYTLMLAEWIPYVTYHLNIERATFMEESDLSLVPVGNLIITVSVMTIIVSLSLALFVKYRKRRSRRSDSLEAG